MTILLFENLLVQRIFLVKSQEWPNKTATGSFGLGDLRIRNGGAMNIREAILVPAILALGLAGVSLSGVEIAAALAHTTTVQTSVAAAPQTVYQT
jgi:hypothetical protein